MKKKKLEKFDGLNPDDFRKIKIALRKVWSWSYSRKLVEKRCLLKNGFSKCEKCRKVCAKVFVDHIKNIGAPDVHLISKMFVPSNQMQGLCKKCHDAKTKEERKQNAAQLDFY